MVRGRCKSNVHNFFVHVEKTSLKYKKVKCKECNKEMPALLSRMKKHLESCVPYAIENEQVDNGKVKFCIVFF